MQRGITGKVMFENLVENILNKEMKNFQSYTFFSWQLQITSSQTFEIILF